MHSLYEKQSLGYITRAGGKVRVQPANVADEIRRLVNEEGADPNDAGLLPKARALAAAKPVSEQEKARHRTSFGYLLLWLSELGKKDDLDGILEYLDTHKKPTWERGGLYYARDDTPVDDEGNETQLGTLAANACIPYARLNVTGGQKTMFEHPWTRDLLAARPCWDGAGVALDSGVDCLRATWDAGARALIFTGRTWHGEPATVRPTARNLAAGTWAVYVDGELRQTAAVEAGGAVAVEVQFGADEVDVVLKQVS